MLKTTALCWLFAVVGTAACIQSCQKDTNDEFVADDDTFANFSTWTLEATKTGADPALGSAHDGNDASVSRKIYFKNDQDPSGGTYPQGTVIVKHSSNAAGSVNEITAMVKRGGDFNTDGGNWEWFTLESDGSIESRGANLLSGACGNCHDNAASGKDYVFSK